MIETTDETVTIDAQPQAKRSIDIWTLAGWALPALLFILLLTGWEIFVRVTDQPRWFLPSPSSVVRESIDSRWILWDHTQTTLAEVLVGFTIATIVGIVSALGIASSRIAERAIYPLIVASQAIPIIALAPILLIWFGYGMTPKVIVVVLICFFPIAINMADGLRSVDADAINLLRSMGAGRWQIMRIVRIPSAMPFLFSGLRIAAAVSVIGAIVGEWVGASSGLGYLMTRSSSSFQTPLIFAAVGISALLGITMFLFIVLAERLVVPWKAWERKT